MIHLDANFLIGSINQLSPTAALLRGWISQGEMFGASAVAWAEFLNGPVPPAGIQYVDYLIQGCIATFGRAEAAVASDLFNRTGRKRGSLPDCFIAATAICHQAPLATHNRRHFLAFTPLGLQLA